MTDRSRKTLRIGTVTEIKAHEYRVGLTPANCADLVAAGAAINVQSGAGEGSGFGDDEYARAGATVVANAQDVFDRSHLIVKVKEPQQEEIARLTDEHTLFTFLHLAPDNEQTDGLIKSGASCIAYETVSDSQGRLPLLAPMSEVAGRVAVQAGAYMLQKASGGRGVLLGGVPGVAPGRVVIIGGGVVGTQAARIAVGMGAEVILFDRSLPRLRELDERFAGRISTRYSTPAAIELALNDCDLVVGAVLIPGAKAPHLLKRKQLSLLPKGAVLVDVAIDQGGCFETSKPTTHDAPVYTVDGIQHYCVANMPGATPRTSTIALTNATFPYLLAMQQHTVKGALKRDVGLLAGLNVHQGKLTCRAVAEAQGKEWQSVDAVLT